MSARKIALLTAVLLIGVCATLYAFLASEGLSARRKPGDFEYAIANRMLAISIPATVKARKSPIQSTPEILTEAKKQYMEHCAVCHAENGSGKTQTAAGMSPEVPDLRADHIQKLTDGELFYIINNGVRFTGMPGWDLPEHHNWALVALIRQLPKQYPEKSEK